MFTRPGASAVAVAVATLIALSAPAGAGLTKPWDDLTADSWVFPNTARMYPANSDAEYRAGFSTAKNNGGARGTNSLRFNDSSATHHATTDQTGNFDVLCSGTEDFTDVLILMAIDADALPGDFAVSMSGYDFDPAADFCYYDGTAYATGRPAGYHSVTNPTGAPIAYDFTDGMVTILALSGLSFDKDHPVTVTYAFENLPGRAVFSVYGMTGGGSEIYHTNRGVEDLNDAGRGVSTFEVVPVPEPGTLALLACGMLALPRRRRNGATSAKRA